jgi:hypothetical protein
VAVSAVNIGPNRFQQNRTVLWQISMPRSNSKSSICRSDSEYRMYIITVRRMTSGELLKYRKGLCIAEGYGTPVSGSSQFGLTLPMRLHRTDDALSLRGCKQAIAEHLTSEQSIL